VDDPRDVAYVEEEDDSPSLAEIAAQLSGRATELAELEERLAREEISVESLDGRLRVVVTGDGRPVSLHIDRATVKGPERRRLGPLIAELIMTARQQADVRRNELEMDPLPTRDGPGNALGQGRRG
jgi:DNA-binding protein YbaB